MRPLLLALAISLFFVDGTACAPSFSQPPSAGQVKPTESTNPFDKPVEDVRQEIQRWERNANIQISFVIAIILFGALISAFQGSTQKWGKVATLVLGITTSVLTGINAKVFSQDYRTLQSAATEGRVILKRLDTIVAYFQAGVQNRVQEKGRQECIAAS